MKRIAIFAYGLVSYVVFFATFLYSIGFIGNLIVPKSIDSVPEAPLGTALFVNTLLLAVFAIQHSVMPARRSRPGGPASCRRRPSAVPMSCSPRWR
ncbi:MAG: hypothetical protein AAFU65_16040 [Pseudomonadota bacterium]